MQDCDDRDEWEDFDFDFDFDFDLADLVGLGLRRDNLLESLWSSRELLRVADLPRRSVRSVSVACSLCPSSLCHLLPLTLPTRPLLYIACELP